MTREDNDKLALLAATIAGGSKFSRGELDTRTASEIARGSIMLAREILKQIGAPS